MLGENNLQCYDDINAYQSSVDGLPLSNMANSGDLALSESSSAPMQGTDCMVNSGAPSHDLLSQTDPSADPSGAELLPDGGGSVHSKIKKPRRLEWIGIYASPLSFVWHE